MKRLNDDIKTLHQFQVRLNQNMERTKFSDRFSSNETELGILCRKILE